MSTSRPPRYLPTLTEVVDPAPKTTPPAAGSDLEQLVQAQVAAHIDALLPEFRRQVEESVRSALQQKLKEEGRR